MTTTKPGPWDSADSWTYKWDDLGVIATCRHGRAWIDRDGLYGRDPIPVAVAERLIAMWKEREAK